MSFLNEDQKQALREQIRQAESDTSGEIVTVIANRSDGYRFIPMLWATLISLSIPGFYFLYQHLTAGGWTDANDAGFGFAQIYQIQVLVFLALGSLFQYAPIRLALIPKSVKQQRAQRHAREQFFVQNLHQTQNKTGVLIFVSVAEHYVEIMVDSGVAAAVDNAHWQQCVGEFIQHVRSGNIATGFSEAVEQCHEVLREHFPNSGEQLGNDSNELPNHLIEINN